MIDQGLASFKSKMFQIFVLRISPFIFSALVAYVVSMVAFIILTDIFLDQIGSILDLNETHKESLIVGTVYHYGSHHPCGDTINFKDDNGKWTVYKSSLNASESDFLSTHEGERVIVWADSKINNCGNDPWPAQIQYGARLVRDYSVIESKELERRRRAPGQMETALFFIFFPLFYVFVRGTFDN